MPATLYADEMLFSQRAGESLNLAKNLGIVTDADVADAVTAPKLSAKTAANDLAAAMAAKTNVAVYPENEVLKVRLGRDARIPFDFSEVGGARATVALLRADTKAGSSDRIGLI